jgi:dipeptidyl aminopeptidase/acylaminoacyl peptidase
MKPRAAISLFLAILVALPAPAQQPATKLKLETLMKGPLFYGYEPSNLRWSGDSQRIYFSWKRHSDLIRAPFDTYVVGRDGSGLRKLSEEEARQAPPANCDYDSKYQRCVYNQAGDVWLYDFTKDKAKRLTATTDIEAQPRFGPNGDAITYQRSMNLFLHSLADGSIEQLTDIRSGRPPADEEEPKKADPKKTPTSQEFLKEEEKSLLSIIKERSALKEEARARRRRENPRKPYYLPARQMPQGLQLSGDGKYVIATLIERPEGAKDAIVPNYITEAAYTEDLPARSKVGDQTGSSRLAVLDVASGEVKPVDYGMGDKAKPARVSGVTLSDDGKNCAFLLRSADNKDLWRMALDMTTAKARTLATDHDDAWIGGPGVQQIQFFDNDTLLFQSEKTGFSQLYKVPFAGGTPVALTTGNYEVSGVTLSRDRKLIYFTSSEVSPYERHFYSLNPANGVKIKYTREVGSHQVLLSPDEKWMASISSYSNQPDEIFVSEKNPTATRKQLTTSPSPEFLSKKWMDAPLVEIPVRDGKRVPARFYKPANYRPGGPAVIFVHGAGYLQNVHKWWSQYSREYLFHHLLVENGYAVLDMDYRASAGYGRDWRTGIYRFMGGKDLEDNVDGAKWLVSAQGVDPKRIGIYGGSYGGFITLMALFTTPDVFAAGAALRPVTDWAHYNHPYTANILNEPQKDPEAYRKSSPIYHAQGLKNALLICHGMVDVNVHYQDSVRLAQRLIELGKDNWELASYPVEDHGFIEPSSWTDEYRRIFNLFEKNLKR